MNLSAHLIFKVECLTPVHVGSGKWLVRDVDYHQSVVSLRCLTQTQ
jgi:hypothetical protein